MEKIFKENIGMWRIKCDSTHFLRRKGEDTSTTPLRDIHTASPDEWEELPIAELPALTKAEYDAKVAELIRERYTASEEFALHRKVINAAFSPSVASAESSAVMTEYAEYNAFVEQCKAAAKDKEMYHKQDGDRYGED